MTPGARLSAAIDVLADIEARRRPASDALKDWGLAHRFAGSGDRAAIGGLVFDALRRRQSAAWLMDEATPRAILFGALKLERGMGPDAIRRLADGGRFAPAPPTAVEIEALDLGAPRRGARPCARRLSGMARCQARRRVRRGPRRGGCGALQPGAGRPARQHAQGRSRHRRRGARPSPCDADAVVARRAAHRALGGGEEPADPGRARLHRRAGRGPGRRLPACGDPDRRGAARHRDRSLRRRRRQDARAGGADGKSRPPHRHRYRHPPAGADPCEARARGRRPMSRSARRAAPLPCSTISWGRSTSC